jgi:deoxyribonuclease-4
MKIGCHVSISRGYYSAAKTAHAIGAEAFQYFPKNPRSLTVKHINRDDASACADFSKRHGLFSVCHTPYPTNLAVSEPDLYQATVESLRNDLEIAEACGSAGVVVHFGKSNAADPLQVYQNIIQCVNGVLADWHGEAKLLIENQAGEGSSLGSTLEELAGIRRLADYPERIGFCLDTCHAFASGLWNGVNWQQLYETGSQLGYFNELKVIHLNDSKYALGSRKDRHAHLGAGHIGIDNLTALLRSGTIAHIPCILETGEGPDGTHRDEIALAKRLNGR